MSFFSSTEEPQEQGNESVFNQERDLVVVNACLCNQSGFYINHKDFGCTGKCSFFCLTCQHCVKTGTPPLALCCFEMYADNGNHSYLCKGASQCCCQVDTFACPCDENEVYGVCAICGLTLYPTIQCCSTLQDLQENHPKKKAAKVQNAPNSQGMKR